LFIARLHEIWRAGYTAWKRRFDALMIPAAREIRCWQLLAELQAANDEHACVT